MTKGRGDHYSQGVDNIVTNGVLVTSKHLGKKAVQIVVRHLFLFCNDSAFFSSF
jgi:hypothetical protein